MLYWVANRHSMVHSFMRLTEQEHQVFARDTKYKLCTSLPAPEIEPQKLRCSNCSKDCQYLSIQSVKEGVKHCETASLEALTWYSGIRLYPLCFLTSLSGNGHAPWVFDEPILLTHRGRWWRLSDSKHVQNQTSVSTRRFLLKPRRDRKTIVSLLWKGYFWMFLISGRMLTPVAYSKIINGINGRKVFGIRLGISPIVTSGQGFGVFPASLSFRLQISSALKMKVVVTQQKQEKKTKTLVLDHERASLRQMLQKRALEGWVMQLLAGSRIIEVDQWLPACFLRFLGFQSTSKTVDVFILPMKLWTSKQDFKQCVRLVDHSANKYEDLDDFEKL